ncbi:hypothetical protein [Modestobacter versicolor]|uniref:Uncharacterized protein n=1 Tax=Modestobacter versicolor TaxID=429133 RepID=A0A839XXU4_9ACTN|nr:hypothetical protein [Modestobacter versicolor]MBB3675409.1 hypothetical protein [Modestobacter versicolor]
MREQNCPQCRWVAVVDGSGRRRLEMQWTRPGTVTALSTRDRSSVAAHAA